MLDLLNPRFLSQMRNPPKIIYTKPPTSTNTNSPIVYLTLMTYLEQMFTKLRILRFDSLGHQTSVKNVNPLQCQLIYLFTWDNTTSTGEIVSLPTFVNFGSNSTISSTGLALSNESVEVSSSTRCYDVTWRVVMTSRDLSR